MKKILFAIIGAALLSASCSKSDLYVEQNPYRSIVEYGPGSVTVDAPGALTPKDAYDWISFTQSGKSATFTVRRNTTGLVRTAVYYAGKDSLKIFQKAHSLDGRVKVSVVNQGATSLDLNCSLETEFPDDYESWGLIYSMKNDVSTGTKEPQSSKVTKEVNKATINGLKEGTDYFVWGYVESTEGDVIYSDVLAVIPPVFVRAGEDLQAALDNAKEYSEVRVLGGLVYDGPIVFGNKNKNKSISGGWNADFTEQSWDNLTVVDGKGKNRGIICAEDASGSPMNGSASVSFFEVKNCNSGVGNAILASGGPVTISNCYVHDNTCGSGGAISTNDGGNATELNIANCIITRNTCSSGHGAAVQFGSGASENDPTKGLMVNCLVYDNWCNAFGGYACALFVQDKTVSIIVNNTIVENFNYMDGDTLYQGIVLRDGTLNLFANNIIAGNTIAIDKQNPPVPFRHPNVIGAGSSGTTIMNNVYEGTWRGGDNVVAKDNQMCEVDFDCSTVYNSTYRPVGFALGLGTTANATLKRGSFTYSVSIKSILDQYNKDLAGNPRVVDGKIDAGCYQTQ